MNVKESQKELKGTLLLAGAVPLAAEPGLPPRMRILRWGNNPNARNKRVHVGRALVESLRRDNYPYRTIPLDFEHNTLPGTPAYKETREPRLVAAHCKVEVVEGDGVYIVPLRWTPEGEQRLAHYCDLSASPLTRADGEVVAVVSAALCRVGAVPDIELPTPLSASILLEQNEVTKMNWKEMVCKALGLDPAIATDDEIVTKLAEALNKAPEATALNAAIEAAVKPLREELNGLKGEAKAATSGEGISAQVEALSASVTALGKELIKRDKQALLEQARLEGKVIALNASAVEAMNLDDLQEHIKQVPVTVPLSALTPAVVPEHQVGTGITDEQRVIALSCGMNPEAIFGGKK